MGSHMHTGSPEEETGMDYQPIDCSLHDRFEAAAVRKQTVRLTWVEEGASGERTGLIADVIVRAGAEYLVLDDGTWVRLDYIRTFEEVSLP